MQYQKRNCDNYKCIKYMTVHKYMLRILNQSFTANNTQFTLVKLAFLYVWCQKQWFARVHVIVQHSRVLLGE